MYEGIGRENVEDEEWRGKRRESERMDEEGVEVNRRAQKGRQEKQTGKKVSKLKGRTEDTNSGSRWRQKSTLTNP